MGEMRGAYLREAVLHISGLRPRRSECRGRSTTRASCRASCRACSARLAGRTRIRSRAVFVVPRHTRSTTLPTRDYKPAVHESAIQLVGVCKMMGPPFKEHSHILHDIATKFKESWAWIRMRAHARMPWVDEVVGKFPRCGAACFHRATSAIRGRGCGRGCFFWTTIASDPKGGNVRGARIGCGEYRT